MYGRFVRALCSDARLSVALACGALSMRSALLEDSTSPPAFPYYRKAEVARHKTRESGVWVTYR